jgi:protein-S-isoprenylcysteine O-methyltransferase Ste14
METKMKHPGVYIPQPLIYVLIFLVSILLQKLLPYTVLFFKTVTATISGGILVAFGLIFILPAIAKSVKSNNTLIPIKPANSLQSDGIYSLTRNPHCI